MSSNTKFSVLGKKVCGEYGVSCVKPKYGFWGVPGQGEAKARCGEVLFGFRCENWGSPQQTLNGKEHARGLAYYTCHRPECPVCHGSWAKRESQAILERLLGVREAYRAEGLKLRSPRAFVVSPPQDWAVELAFSGEDGDYGRLKSGLYRVLRENGFLGGCAVFHPYRILPELKPVLKKAGYGRGEAGLWEGVLCDALGLGGWERYVYPSPHFHVLGFGRLKGSREFYEDTGGWTYKNLGSRDSEKSIVGTARYMLSHAGVSGGFHVVVWFGIASYSMVGSLKSKVQELVRCEACGGVVLRYPVGLDDEVDWDCDCPEELYVWRILREFYLTELAKSRFAEFVRLSGSYRGVDV